MIPGTRRIPLRECAAVLLLFAPTLGCVTESKQRVSPLEVSATVEGMRPSDSKTAGPLVMGLGGTAPVADASAAARAQDPQAQTRGELEAHLKNLFGYTVVIGLDGRVTKQYFLVGELGPTFLKLVQEIRPDQPVAADAGKPLIPPPGTKVGGEGSKSVLGQMLGGREVEITYLPDFEKLSGARIADPPSPSQGSAVTGAPMQTDVVNAASVALLLVTATPAGLTQFENMLSLFYDNIPQVQIEVKVIEFQNADALAFGVTGIDQTTPNIENLSSGALVQAYTSIFPLRQPVVGASPVTDVGLFTLGGIHDNWELNLVLQALEAKNAADIQSSPSLVVRNGGVASISTLTQIPFPKARINQGINAVTADIEFKPVGVKMNIIPVIAGKDTVLLQIYADVSAVTGFANTSPVVTPITSQRTAVTTVYLKNKHTLMIGGLNSVTDFSSETKVPILGDIPLLGFLFRSTSKSRQETTVAFTITPTIVNDRGVIGGGEGGR